MAASSLQRICLESVAKNLAMWCESTSKEDFFKYTYVVGPFNDLSSSMIQQLLEISCNNHVFKASYFPIFIHGNISQLNLSVCHSSVTDQVLKLIQLRCKNITHLSLAGCSRISSKYLNNILPTLFCLKNLNLSNCISCSDQLLMEFGKRPGFDFQELNLESCQGVSDVGIFALLRQEYPSLYNLNLSSTSVTSNMLFHVLVKVPWLKRLSFSNIQSSVECTKLSVDQVHSTQLQYLDISNTEFSNTTLEILFTKSTSKLTELKMNQTEGQCLNELMLSLSCLTSLDLEGVTEAVHFGDLRNFLINQGHHLKSLNLSGLPDVEISMICLYCQQLRTLILADCENINATLPAHSLEVADQRAVSMETYPYFSNFCRSLHSLNLNRSSLTTSTVMSREELLLNLLINHGHLKQLMLGGLLCINDVVLVSVFDSTTCSVLRTLHLPHCKHITTTSVHHILDKCKNLRSLDLSHCWNITLGDISMMKEHLRNIGRYQMNITWV